MPATYASRLEGLTTSVAVKAPCRVATTAAMTLSGLQTVDGVALAARDRVLVKNQTDATQNGIWVAATGRWPRALDFNGTLDAVGGTEVLVAEGTQSGIWRTTGIGVIVIGTDEITFVRLSIIGDGLAPESLSSWDPTDATAALQEAALSSSGQVRLTLGVDYPFDENIDIAVDGQHWYGGGTLKPIGAVGLRVVDGAIGVKLQNLTFDAPDHTGYAIKVISSHRTFIDNINMVDVYSPLYVEEANTTHVNGLWATIRGPGIKWYGSDAKRSDILSLVNVTLGHSNLLSTDYGLDWDGNCHTLNVLNVGLVGGKGAIVRNTSGGATFPAIGRFFNLQSDYSTGNSLRIDAGLDYDIIGCYFLGAANSGIYVGATINDYEVRITGGKSVGSTTRYGIEAAGGVVIFGGDAALYSNFLGETLGNVWDRPIQLRFDVNFFMALLATNPTIGFDNNDYLAYDRATNTLAEYIGGVAVRTTTATATAIAGLLNTPRSIVSDTPITAPISVNGIPSQYYRVQNLMVNDVPPGSGSFGQGQLQVLFADDTKPVTDIIARSRGATIGASAALAAGDQIYQQLWYGDTGPGLGSYMAHAGWIKIAIDGAPLGDPTEIPGWWGLATGTGLHIPGSRYAMEINSKQQVHFPGPLSNPLGPTGTSYGANVLLGVGAAAAGSAPLKFIPAGAVLLGTAESGAVEVDSAGIFYVTNSSAARRRVVDADGSNVLSTGLTFGGALKKKQYTVGTLPGGPATGDEYVVTDATAPVWGTAVTGGGAVLCTAQWSGANWIAR